jgi:transcription initiation factor TFIIF subunit alpha
MMAKSAVGTRVDNTEANERGRSKIKTVVSAGGAGKKKRGGQDQDDDEFDYEEDFQDDEEGIAKIDDLADEAEAKELEVRRLRFSSFCFPQTRC